MESIFTKIVKNARLWIGVLILYYFIIKSGADFSIIGTINYVYLVLPFSLLLLEISIKVLRWDFISKTLFLKTKKLTNAKIFFIGQALNELAPQGTGEITKAYLSNREYGDKGRSILAPVLERLLDISLLVFSSLFVLLFISSAVSGYALPLLFMLSSVFIAIAFFSKPHYLESIVGFFVKTLTKNTKTIEKNTITWRGVTKTKVFGLVCLTAFCWVIEALAQSYIFYLMGYRIDALHMLSIIAFSVVVAIPTFLPGGIGAKEVVYTYLLSFVGVPTSAAISVAVLWRAAYWLFLFVFAGASYITLDDKTAVGKRL